MSETPRPQLTDAQWNTVAALLFQKRGPGRPGKNDRRFVEAVLWWRRTGVPWRDLHPAFGPWKTVFNRFDRWSKKGRWNRLFERLQKDPDLEKARAEVECTINLLKQARRFATRYEKTLRNYAAVVALGCALLWLRI
jgi:putative transposase